MPKTKIYQSVSAMLRDITEEDSAITAAEFDEYIAERKLVKDLAILRSARGLSQADVAKKLDRSQSWVSKLEHGTDDELCLGDLRAYLSVFGLEFRAGVVKQNATIVDEVKLLAFAIRQKLITLAGMAKEGDELVEHIAQFFGDAFHNINRFLCDAAAKLPRKPDNKPYISIITMVEDMQSLEDEEKEESTIRKNRIAKRRGPNHSSSQAALR
jgi:transcriptional regulator with XRE-family HTH domain